MGKSGTSIVVASVGRQLWPAADAETASSFLRFATIQCIERKQDLADLAPKHCFMSAEAIEREVGQIGETQKATCEVSGGIDGRFDRFRPRGGCGFCYVRDAVRCRIETDVVSSPEQRIDYVSRGRVNSAPGSAAGSMMVIADYRTRTAGAAVCVCGSARLNGANNGSVCGMRP